MEKFTKEQAIAIVKEGNYATHYPQVTSFVVCQDGNVFLPFNAADARAHARSKDIGIETILLSDLEDKSQEKAAAAKEAGEKAAAEKADDKTEPGAETAEVDAIVDVASETIEAAAEAPSEDNKEVKPAKKGK